MTRSELMARIRSTGNASTELALARALRRAGVTDWHRQQKILGISVDFVFRKSKIALFADGCFWHGCPVHSRLMSLSDYWFNKIVANQLRDQKQTALLRNYGWKVVRVWEHSLKGIKQ